VTPAVRAAKVALPAASYAETAGTVVNFMGVAQSYSPALKPKGRALSHSEIMGRLADAAQRAEE
jgi:NADH-quinone oxidoreductase subunit G